MFALIFFTSSLSFTEYDRRTWATFRVIQMSMKKICYFMSVPLNNDDDGDDDEKFLIMDHESKMVQNWIKH